MFSGVATAPRHKEDPARADEDGRLTATSHDVIEQSAKIKEFAEQTAYATRTMYATQTRRTTHRLAALDVDVPSWMRAPGEAPGMYALEAAMDEMAVRCNLDPIEFRIRNEPEVDAETGLPYSSRNLAASANERALWVGGPRPDPARPAEGRWPWGPVSPPPCSRLQDAWREVRIISLAKVAYKWRSVPWTSARDVDGTDQIARRRTRCRHRGDRPADRGPRLGSIRRWWPPRASRSGFDHLRGGPRVPRRHGEEPFRRRHGRGRIPTTRDR